MALGSQSSFRPTHISGLASHEGVWEKPALLLRLLRQVQSSAYILYVDRFPLEFSPAPPVRVPLSGDLTAAMNDSFLADVRLLVPQEVRNKLMPHNPGVSTGSRETPLPAAPLVPVPGSGRAP